MTRRFRLLAGPNGSGKTTLKRRLERDYAVNFYDFLEEGLACVDDVKLSSWFVRLRPTLGEEAAHLPRGTTFETSAEAASRAAVKEAFAAGLPITVLKGGRVVRMKEEAR